MTDDMKDTGVKTDRASVEALCQCPSAEPYRGTMRALLAERDAAIARAEKAEESRTAAYTRLMDADATNDYLCAMVCESQSQADALKAEVARLRKELADLSSGKTFAHY